MRRKEKCWAIFRRCSPMCRKSSHVWRWTKSRSCANDALKRSAGGLTPPDIDALLDGSEWADARERCEAAGRTRQISDAAIRRRAAQDRFSSRGCGAGAQPHAAGVSAAGSVHGVGMPRVAGFEQENHRAVARIFRRRRLHEAARRQARLRRKQYGGERSLVACLVFKTRGSLYRERWVRFPSASAIYK